MIRSLRVHIIGAGIAGLTTAVALRRAGFAPRVYEQAAELGEVGAGLTIGPNAARVLKALGLESKLRPWVWTPRHVGVLDGFTGKSLSYRERGADYESQFGAPLWHIHRADLLQVLANTLDSEQTDIYLNHQVVSLEQNDQEITTRFTNGDSARCDLLIACDGLKSRVRDLLFPGPAPEYTGFAAWRGLTPRSQLPQLKFDPDFALYVGPNRFFARYGVRNRSLINFVAMARKPEWVDESWSLKADVSEVLSEYEGWHADVRSIIASAPQDDVFQWALHVRLPLDSWVSGRIALLGDAAHPMTPFLGLGAGIGIEDAMILTRALECSEHWTEGLERYQRARISRANHVQAESANQGLYLLNREPGQAADRSMMGEDPLGLYGYDAVHEPV